MPTASEDEATAQLGWLLQQHPAVKPHFLDFLFAGSPPPRVLEADLAVQVQRPTRDGKIDLLLHDSDLGIIVESKVRDRHKIFQLRKYHDWWLRKTGARPFIFWLVQRMATGLGRNEYLTRELTWNQLCEDLRSKASKMVTSPSRAAIIAFCEWLEASGILLSPGAKRTVRRRNKGYSYEDAERTLAEIAQRFGGIRFRVDPPENELPHRLAIGRESWLPRLGGDPVERVLIYYQPYKLQDGITRFFFRPEIVFWHQNYGSRLEFAIQQFPNWAAICHRHRMRMWRNKPGKWLGIYNVEIRPPYGITTPVKFFLADDQALARQQFRFDANGAQIQVGLQCVERYLKIVDEF